MNKDIQWAYTYLNDMGFKNRANRLVNAYNKAKGSIFTEIFEKKRWKKLITHTLINIYNDCEPMDDVWIARVRKAIEEFNSSNTEKLKEGEDGE